jgi:cyanate permease
MIFLGLKFVLCEGFMAPTITMMQRSAKPEHQGSIVAGYFFILTLGGFTSTAIMGQLINFFDATSNPEILGKLVFLMSGIGYLGAAPAYWMAGRHYKRLVGGK